ncbi:MAG: hypothetical protein BWZ08_01641 [candidate division BRC1 bacterium ADurb.BinA292]|nr:MAG: hypothetical protein BWZ08_01641 [candidate division BRC1 bacterium ADurb.BinA292]
MFGFDESLEGQWLTMNSPQIHRVLRAAATVPLALLLILAVGGCAGLDMGGQQQLMKDIASLERKIDALADQQSESEHKIAAQLGSVTNNLDQRGGVTLNAVEQLSDRMLAVEQALDEIEASIERLASELESQARSQRNLSQLNPSSRIEEPRPRETTPAENPVSPIESSPVTAQPSVPSGDIETLVTEAQHQINMGNHDQGIEILEQAMEQSPTKDQQIEIHYWLGEAHFLTNRLPDAFGHYNDLIHLDPRSARAWNSLERMAEIRVNQDRCEDAIKLLDNFKQYPNYDGIDRVNRLRERAEACR